tara:strand:+ start:1662 stop:2696 length:1035 start_codon:yes stop_codon:yes gene_type:complete
MVIHSKKPIVSVLSGQQINPPPIWLMRQAGRYLPEYQEIRNQGGGFFNLCFNPQKATEVTMQPIRRFNLDAAILFSDILVIPHALGQTVKFKASGGPYLKPISDYQEIKDFSAKDIQTTLSPIYQTVKNVSNLLSDTTALIGFAGAPWTVAAYMVEGESSQNFTRAKKWALGDPDGFENLINLLIEVTSAHLIQQVAFGADVLQLFDSWSGLLPATAFDRFCVKPICEIVDRVKDTYPDVPIIVFPRGAGPKADQLAKHPRIDAISIDFSIEPSWAARKIQPYAAVQGNLDPVYLMVGGEELYNQARKIINALSKGPHIFNLGHGIQPTTPVDNVHALIKAVRE